MQIIIEIPKEIYEASQMLDVKHEDVIQIPLEVIANGKPLSKGHGRIVDGDEILIWMISKGILDKFKCGEIAPVFERATIIKADRGGADGK